MPSHQQHKWTRHKQKHDQRQARLSPTKQLHITVAVSPGMGADVAREVQMVKAALLYADAVSLCSPGISTVLATRDPSRLNAQERTNLLLQIAPLLGFPSENMKTFEVMLNAIRKPAARQSPFAGMLMEFQSKIDQTWQDIAEKSDQIIQQTGTYQLIPLLQSGLVKLHPLPVTLLDVLTTSVDRSLGRKNTEEAARRYFEVVSRAIQSFNTHLLLDEDTSSLVQLAIRDEVLQVNLPFNPQEVANNRSDCQHIGEGQCGASIRRSV